VTCAEGNDELARLVGRHPDRLVGLLTYDPRQSSQPAKVMERGRQLGLRGLALFPTPSWLRVGRRDIDRRGLRLAAEWQWAVVVPIRLIMCWWMPVTRVDNIVDAARRHPRTSIIAASANFSELGKLLGAMGSIPNLYIELSGAQGLDALVQLVERGDPDGYCLARVNPYKCQNAIWRRLPIPL